MSRLILFFATLGVFIVISACKKECDLSFIFTDSITDIQGNTYTTIELGSQTWMASNLTSSLFNSSESMPEVQSDSAWAATTSPAWSKYDNNATNDASYGKLYNHAVVSSSSNVCPAGWHVPTKADWKELTGCMGGDDNAALKLKENTKDVWWVPNHSFSTNESTFSALPGGVRDHAGDFQNQIYLGYFWTSTLAENRKASLVSMHFGSASVNHFDADTHNGASIRCIKD